MDSQAEIINFRMSLLLELFPGGDFAYLKSKAEEFSFNGGDESFEHFVSNALATNSVPLSAPLPTAGTQSDVLVTYDLLSFFEACPDPFNYFETLQRTATHERLSIEFLKDRFRFVLSSEIEAVAANNKCNLIKCCNALASSASENLNSFPRLDEDIKLTDTKSANDFNLEVYLLDHQDEIRQHMAAQAQIRTLASQTGQVFECECCFTDDILADEVVACSEAHVFCKSCVKRGVETQLGYGRVDFPCLSTCTPDGCIPLESVKQVLNSKAYQSLLDRIQEDEVQRANILGLVQCQKCEYAAVLDEQMVIFKCAKCFFEMCRMCNKENHVPRKCFETPQEDEQKQMRKRGEEVETSKVVRKCGRCKKSIIKYGGCNKITCTCGNTLCYLCGASGIDYAHLNRCEM